MQGWTQAQSSSLDRYIWWVRRAHFYSKKGLANREYASQSATQGAPLAYECYPDSLFDGGHGLLRVVIIALVVNRQERPNPTPDCPRLGEDSSVGRRLHDDDSRRREPS